MGQLADGEGWLQLVPPYRHSPGVSISIRIIMFLVLVRGQFMSIFDIYNKRAALSWPYHKDIVPVSV